MIKRIQFEVERLLLRGVHYRLLVAVAIVMIVAIVAGGLMLLLDPRFEELTGAVWWAFLRLTDPGYLGDDEGATSRTISTIVTVLGYILFLGLLIAILTQWMNEWIQRVEQGFSRLTFEGHILILGWNHRTPSIVLELLRTKARTARFLEARDDARLRIVVLAEDVDVALRGTLRSALGDLWDDRQVVLRSGNPLHIDSLERVAFRTAGAIILPGADFALARAGVSDAESIKALASISHHASDGNQVPLAVIALYNNNRRRLAESAYRGHLAVVDADRMVARLLSQSALQLGVWDVFSEMLSINEGNALFLRTMPTGEEVEFRDLQAGSGNGILVGTMDGETGTVRLNPPAEHVVQAGDELVFVGRRYDDCVISRGDGSLSKGAERTQLVSPEGGGCRVLVLGWSRKVPLLVRELLNYGHSVEAIHVVGITPVADREGAASITDNRVEQISANFLDPGVLMALNPAAYDTVILIARERLGDEAVADAATLSTYLALEDMQAESRPHVVVEVLEEENQPLFDTERDDVMLSPTVVSYVISQIALKPDLGRVFQKLAQPTGSSIAILDIKSELAGTSVRFAEMRELARQDGYLTIGVFAQSLNDGRLTLNPAEDTSWQLVEGDRLVVLTAD